MDFKDYFDWALVDELGLRISFIDKNFNAKRFNEAVTDDLLSLEMKGRVKVIASSLYHAIEKPYAEVVPIILASLDKGKYGTDNNRGKLRGFPVWVIATIVEDYGIEHPYVSLTALHKITQHFTGEFAIRPYLEEHPELTLATLNKWTNDNSADVRRLVSEGTRPKLPWASKVNWLINNPLQILPLLDKLYNDDSEYVRRSVANHLNDISKTHPEMVINTLSKWRKENGESDNLDWIIRHAFRSLIKSSHPGALQLQGYHSEVNLTVIKFDVIPNIIALGDKFIVTLEVELNANSAKPNDQEALIIDLLQLSPSATNKPRRRILKWCRRSIDPNSRLGLTKSWSIKDTTTRKELLGHRQIELIINGKSLAQTSFEVV